MGTTIMNTLTVLYFLGMPTVIALVVRAVKLCKKYTKHIQILMKAQKAQMRSQLLAQYHEYESAGWVSEEDLEDWENQYQAYHELVGDNGVLDARREKLLKMPNQEQ